MSYLRYCFYIIVQSLSCVQLLRSHGLQHARLPCPSPSPWVCSKLKSSKPRACANSCSLSWWCHPTISSSVTLFSYLKSFPVSGYFPMSWHSAAGSQRTRTSALASVLPTNIQGWFPLGFTGLISLQSKGFSRVFASTTVQKHQFFGIQPSLRSNSHISTWLLEKP